MNDSYLRSIYWRLTGVVMIAVVAALVANSYLSHRAFERALVPEMAKKTATVGASVRALMLKAVEHRVDFRALHGVDQTFDSVVEENPDFSYLAATDAGGVVLYQRGDPPSGIEAYLRTPATLAKLSSTDAPSDAARVGAHYIVSMPIVAADGPLGILHIGVDAGFVENIVFEMLLDVLVVLVVALFFTLELLNFIAGTQLEAGLRSLAGLLERGRTGNFAMPAKAAPERELGGVLKLLEAAAARVNAGYLALTRDIEAARRAPAHERKASLSAAHAGLQALRQRFHFDAEPAVGPVDGTQLARIRAPLFAFILAEELTRSFLPSYVKDLLVPIPGLPPEIVVGLPIVLFMLIVALGQPYFGAYSERLGHRRTMLVGASIAAAGFAASAMAHSVLDLLVWRSLCGLGYGMVFVAAQGFVLDHTRPENRARGFALFVGAIMVATVCGPSIGGILADNIGERLALAISALLAIGSIFAIQLLPVEPARRANHIANGGPRLRDIVALMLNRRFMTLTGLAAIPAKVILTGICFYLVPLYVISIGSTQSMAGRILMTYAVVMVTMVPVATSLAKNREHREWLVAAGLLVSGLGGFVMIASTNISWVFAAVFLVGVGQSLSITAQSALVSEHCHEEIARLGDQTVFGVYRLLERLGNAMGPLIAAALVVGYGYQRSFVVIGALVMICGIAFAWATRTGRSPAHAIAG
ncbi:MAG: MFS transporter [Burkholderiales bacterium]